MSFAFDAVSAVLLIPVAAALLLVLVPGYRLSAHINVAASLLTLLAAVLLLFDRPSTNR
jgi:hydrogenase-4 component F